MPKTVRHFKTALTILEDTKAAVLDHNSDVEAVTAVLEEIAECKAIIEKLEELEKLNQLSKRLNQKRLDELETMGRTYDSNMMT